MLQNGPTTIPEGPRVSVEPRRQSLVKRDIEVDVFLGRGVSQSQHIADLAHRTDDVTTAKSDTGGPKGRRAARSVEWGLL